MLAEHPLIGHVRSCFVDRPLSQLPNDNRWSVTTRSPDLCLRKRIVLRAPRF